MTTLQSTQVVSTIAAMRRARRDVTGTLGLVPTMGALHEGHLSLVRAAKRHCDRVAVSIFVNPTQFAPNEDFTQYPRTFEHDLTLLECEGVDLVFAPSAEEIYPATSTHTFVEVPAIGDRLEGRSRPGHLRAVATIVAKLFHIVSPDAAFFGQKDAAQVAVLRAMVRDLNFPLDFIVCPTVRDPDGLAMSSRNRYLTPEQRADALAIHRALHHIETLARTTSSAAELQRILAETLSQSPGLTLDYAEIVDPDTLLPIEDIRTGALIAVAAFAGLTRLVDNILLPPAGAAS